MHKIHGWIYYSPDLLSNTSVNEDKICSFINACKKLSRWSIFNAEHTFTFQVLFIRVFFNHKMSIAVSTKLKKLNSTLDLWFYFTLKGANSSYVFKSLCNAMWLLARSEIHIKDHVKLLRNTSFLKFPNCKFALIDNFEKLSIYNPDLHTNSHNYMFDCVLFCCLYKHKLSDNICTGIDRFSECKFIS